MSTNIPLPTKTALRTFFDNFEFIRKQWQKFSYAERKFRQYGLYHDDLYRDGHEDVAEAVRRLPENLYISRVHRLHRAMQLDRAKIYLPEAMWTKMEDKNHNYLTPYLNEVTKEKLERAAWESK